MLIRIIFCIFLHLYKDNGNLICYKVFEGQSLIIPEGRPQKIGEHQPEKTETEEELIKRLTEFFTEKHRRLAEVNNLADKG